MIKGKVALTLVLAATIALSMIVPVFLAVGMPEVKAADTVVYSAFDELNTNARAGNNNGPSWYGVVAGADYDDEEDREFPALPFQKCVTAGTDGSNYSIHTSDWSGIRLYSTPNSGNNMFFTGSDNYWNGVMFKSAVSGDAKISFGSDNTCSVMWSVAYFAIYKNGQKIFPVSEDYLIINEGTPVNLVDEFGGQNGVLTVSGIVPGDELVFIGYEPGWDSLLFRDIQVELPPAPPPPPPPPTAIVASYSAMSELKANATSPSAGNYGPHWFAGAWETNNTFRCGYYMGMPSEGETDPHGIPIGTYTFSDSAHSGVRVYERMALDGFNIHITSGSEKLPGALMFKAPYDGDAQIRFGPLESWGNDNWGTADWGDSEFAIYRNRQIVFPIDGVPKTFPKAWYEFVRDFGGTQNGYLTIPNVKAGDEIVFVARSISNGDEFEDWFRMRFKDIAIDFTLKNNDHANITGIPQVKRLKVGNDESEASVRAKIPSRVDVQLANGKLISTKVNWNIPSLPGAYQTVVYEGALDLAGVEPLNPKNLKPSLTIERGTFLEDSYTYNAYSELSRNLLHKNNNGPNWFVALVENNGALNYLEGFGYDANEDGDYSVDGNWNGAIVKRNAANSNNIILQTEGSGKRSALAFKVSVRGNARLFYTTKEYQDWISANKEIYYVINKNGVKVWPVSEPYAVMKDWVDQNKSIGGYYHKFGLDLGDVAIGDVLTFEMWSNEPWPQLRLPEPIIQIKETRNISVSSVESVPNAEVGTFADQMAVEELLPDNVLTFFDDNRSQLYLPVTWSGVRLPANGETVTFVGDIDFSGTTLQNHAGLKAYRTIRRLNENEENTYGIATISINAYEELKKSAQGGKNGLGTWKAGTVNKSGKFTPVPTVEKSGLDFLYTDVSNCGVRIIETDPEYNLSLLCTSTVGGAICFTAPAEGSAKIKYPDSPWIAGSKSIYFVYVNGKKVFPPSPNGLLLDSTKYDPKLLYGWINGVRETDGFTVGNLKKGDTVVMAGFSATEYAGSIKFGNPAMEFTGMVNCGITEANPLDEMIIPHTATYEQLIDALPTKVLVTFNNGGSTKEIGVSFKTPVLPEIGQSVTVYGTLDMGDSGLKNNRYLRAALKITRQAPVNISTSKYAAWEKYSAASNVLDFIDGKNLTAAHWSLVRYNSAADVKTLTKNAGVYYDYDNDINTYFADDSIHASGTGFPDRKKVMFRGWSDFKFGVGFKAATNGIFKLLPTEGFDEIVALSSHNEPVGFSVYVNDKKVFPTDKETFLLYTGFTYQLPDIPEITLKKGESVYVLVNGKPYYTKLSAYMGLEGRFRSTGNDESANIYKDWTAYPAVSELYKNAKAKLNEGPRWTAEFNGRPCTKIGTLWASEDRAEMTLYRDHDPNQPYKEKPPADETLMYYDQGDQGGVIFRSGDANLDLTSWLEYQPSVRFTAPSNGSVKLINDGKLSCFAVPGLDGSKEPATVVKMFVELNGTKVYPAEKDEYFEVDITGFTDFPDIPEIRVNEGDKVGLAAQGMKHYSYYGLKVNPTALFIEGEGRGIDKTGQKFTLIDEATGLNLTYEYGMIPENCTLEVKKVLNGDLFDKAAALVKKEDEKNKPDMMLRAVIKDENGEEVTPEGYCSLSLPCEYKEVGDIMVYYSQDISDETSVDDMGADVYDGGINFTVMEMGDFIYCNFPMTEAPVAAPPVAGISWVLVAVIIGAGVLLLGGGGATAFIVIKKRKGILPA